jgi:hypothetical protein
MRHALSAALLCLLWPRLALAQDEAPAQYNTIVLQGLNKVTGHILRIEGPLGSALRFGNLEIVARRCWKAPPEDQPENAALLSIAEFRSGEAPHSIFSGWMFSSSPGLSGLEHPVYDITVLACEERADPENLEKPAETPPPPQDTPKPKPSKKPQR